jgi:hypothetical protein
LAAKRGLPPPPWSEEDAGKWCRGCCWEVAAAAEGAVEAATAAAGGGLCGAAAAASAAAEPEPEAEAEAKGAALGPSVAVPTLSTSAEKATCGNLRFLNPSLAAVQGPLGIPATSSHCSVMPKWGLKKARRP